jgi:hypothetical protein
LVHENIISLEYYRIEDQIVDIFTKPLTEDIFINIYMMLGLHEAAIMGRGGVPSDVISPPEYP